jgi:hypothetical protein
VAFNMKWGISFSMAAGVLESGKDTRLLLDFALQRPGARAAVLTQVRELFVLHC